MFGQFWKTNHSWWVYEKLKYKILMI